MPGFEKFADLEQVDQDAINVKRGVIGLGARKTDITEVENADFQELYSLMQELRDEIRENWRNGEKKTLIFVYFAGHGVMTDMTHAVCNGGYDK